MTELTLRDPYAEKAVLGACLIDPEAIFLLNGLEPTHFGGGYKGEDHAALFQVLQALARRGQRIDFTTASSELGQRGLVEHIGGTGYLVSLISSTPSSTHVESYAHTVQDLATRRRLAQALADCIKMVHDSRIDSPVAEVQSHLSHFLDAGSSDELVHADELLSQYLDLYARRESGEVVPGLSTGFRDLDRLISLREHEYVVVGGRPSMGKTAWVEGLAEHIAGLGHTVLFMSIEMDPLQGLTERRVSRWARLSKQQLERGEADLHDLSVLVGQHAGKDILYLNTRSPSPMRLRAHLKKLEARGQLPRLVIVDYLQLMQAEGENDYQRVSRISSQLNEIKREFPLTVVAVSQLSRAVEGRQDKHPILSDLRESGLIEQDADIILFVYRDEVYSRDTGRVGIADIDVAKHRNGPIGRVELAWLGEQTRFVDLLGRMQ